MKRRAEHVGLCSLYYSVNMIKLDASTTSAWLMLCTLSNLLHSMHLASWDPPTLPCRLCSVGRVRVVTDTRHVNIP